MSSVGGLGTSESSASDQEINVSGAAGQGARGSAQARDNAISLNKSKLNTGLNLEKLSAGNDLNLTIGDGGAQAAEIAAQFQDTLKALSDNNAAAIGTVTQASSDQQKTLAQQLAAALQSGLDKVSSLAGSAQTGGVDINKFIKWGLVGGLVLGGLYITRDYWKKSK